MVSAERHGDCFDLGVRRFIKEQTRGTIACLKFCPLRESLSTSGVEVLSKPDAGVPPAPDSSCNLNLAWGRHPAAPNLVDVITGFCDDCKCGVWFMERQLRSYPPPLWPDVPGDY